MAPASVGRLRANAAPGRGRRGRARPRIGRSTLPSRRRPPATRRWAEPVSRRGVGACRVRLSAALGRVHGGTAGRGGPAGPPWALGGHRPGNAGGGSLGGYFSRSIGAAARTETVRGGRWGCLLFLFSERGGHIGTLPAAASGGRGGETDVGITEGLSSTYGRKVTSYGRWRSYQLWTVLVVIRLVAEGEDGRPGRRSLQAQVC